MLPSELIKQVRQIQMRTGRQVADVLAGAYTSVFKGRGMEFEEVRPYIPGDDVRAIDWNVTARSGVPHVKRFVEERELTIMIIADISASQDFGSGSRSKREAAAELSALLAFSANQNNDKVGLLLFHGETELYIPPRKGARHALRVVREVLAHGGVDLPGKKWGSNPVKPKIHQRLLTKLKIRNPRRETNISAAVEHCRNVLKRRSVMFVISDFLDDGYMAALRSANRKHDVVAAHICDQREFMPVNAGIISLTDAESGKTAVVDTGSANFRKLAEQNALNKLDELKSKMVSAGIDLIRIDASKSVVDPLVAFFRMRQKRIYR